jgi:hypothetical protein
LGAGLQSKAIRSTKAPSLAEKLIGVSIEGLISSGADLDFLQPPRASRVINIIKGHFIATQKCCKLPKLPT